MLFLGSDITGSADFSPRVFLNPEVTMDVISCPIHSGWFSLLSSEIPIKLEDKLSLRIFSIIDGLIICLLYE